MTLFWPGAKVPHYYYDLYAFVKNCAVPVDIITLVYRRFHLSVDT